MGNAVCSSGKAQLLYDVTREIADGAEEWMGKGLLTAERFVTDGELRLPPRMGEVHPCPLTQSCKKVVRRFALEEHSSFSQTSRNSKTAPTELPGPFVVDFAFQGEPECRKLEVLLTDCSEQPDTHGSAEEDGKGIAALVGNYGATRAAFAVTLRVEFASVAFKKAHSPFRDVANVEGQVEQLLQQQPLDLAHFASTYGNCVVEKVFCGGVMALSFAKEGAAAPSGISAPGPGDTTFEVEVARALFRVQKSQRGGETAFQGLEGKPPLTLEQVEKQVRSWCKSFAPDHLRKAGLRGVGQAVRLRVAPFSKIEGSSAPAALTHMDFNRTAMLEKAKEGLAKAERTRHLAELQAAVDFATEVGLEDARLEPLSRQRRQLDAALDAVRQASQRQDVEALRRALARSEEVDLPDWEKAAHDEAVALLASLLEADQRLKLKAAAEAAEIRPEDLVRILLEALPRDDVDAQPGFTHLEEFKRAEAKLTGLITDLASDAKRDALTEDQSRSYSEVLASLPDIPAVSASRIAASRFAEAAREMSERMEERREQRRRRAELQGELEEVVQQAESAGGDAGEYEDLGQKLREMDKLLPADSVSCGGEESPTTRSLRSLRSRGTALLKEKEAMDQTARQVEARLQEACLGSASAEALESALLDVSAKEQSGALHRATISAQVVEAARRQLVALLRPELEQLVESARSSPVSDGAGDEALAGAKRLLQRLEATCQPTCARECEECARLCSEAVHDLGDRKSRRSSQEGAREKLRHSLISGDPHVVEEALRHAQSCSVPDEFTLDADARLRELQTAERQLRSALESGDRVHLSTALEESTRQGLKTPMVDEAQQRLQSSKTSALVDAIRQRDYYALGRAIAEAESRGPEETTEISDVLEKARVEHAALDRVAKDVASALGTLSYEELRVSVGEARRLKVATEEVRRAENVLGDMEHAVERLKVAVAQQPGDLGLLQESLGLARQQGLWKHPVYQEAEGLFSGTCVPPGMTWAMEEQRRIWVVLCLRQALPGADGETSRGDAVTHPFAMAVFELCHEAQISPEGEPYSVNFIHRTLLALVRLPPSGGSPGQLEEAARAALEGFSSEAASGSSSSMAGVHHGGGETVDAHQFNHIGVVAKAAGLASTRQLLWFLACLLEWESGQRLFLAFMSEQSQRTADLLNEVDSTEHSLRNRMMALQAKGPMDDEAGAGAPVPAPEISPETGHARSRLPSPPPADTEKASGDPRVALLRSVLEGIEQVKRGTEQLQGAITKSKGEPAGSPTSALQEGGERPDIARILEMVQQASPSSLEEARAAAQTQQREATSRAREIYGDTYGVLETKLLQLQYQGRLALDGEALSPAAAVGPVPPNATKEPVATQLPFSTFSRFPEAAASLQDHAFLQLLGVPEPLRSTPDRIDRCFQRVEIYDRFSEKTGAVEDEFEKFSRTAVTEARQRCGGRRLVAALKPLLVDLVKRRQRISSMLNTLRNCGLDKAEKNLLRKHLQPRDVLIALAFSSMPSGPSQARMLSLAAKTDSPLPLLFGWAQPPSAGASPGGAAAGLQLCSQIHWGALRELFCRPVCPLVLSLGTRETLGKSYLLQALYALQEVHFRGRAVPPLRIHDMPSIDIIGDFAREESLRGVTLADVHTYDPSEELCEVLVSTLASCACLMLLHVSLKNDFADSVGAPRPSAELLELLSVLASSRGPGCSSVLLLLRDVDDDGGPDEQRKMSACIGIIHSELSGGRQEALELLVWPVPPLAGLGAQELGNEVKSLRKSRAMPGARGRNSPTLEEALAAAAKSKHKMPSMAVLQERYESFATSLKQGAAGGPHTSTSPPRGTRTPRPVLRPASDDPYGALAHRIFRELEVVGSNEGLLSRLFPVAHCHQQLTLLSQEKVRCVNRGREYMEPEERRKLENSADDLDRQIGQLRKSRQHAPPHALLRTFGQLVLAGDTGAIAAFGAYLDDWKQSHRAPLLGAKLRLRKELDQLLEEENAREEPQAKPPTGSKGPATPVRKKAASGIEPLGSPAPDPPAALVVPGGRAERLLAELATLQRQLDEVDVSTDSFWLELMLWHELERIGERRGLREIDERLTYGAARICYLSWVKNGNPVHFLHSAPLQFGAFEPLRWHPQISGASLFGSDFVGDILRELDRDLGVDARRRPLLVISVIGVQSSGKSTLMNYLFGCSFATHVGRCTKGLYISLLETQRELIVILDTEGLLSVEARDDVFDKQVALMTMACSDLVIVNNRGELGRHVGDLFQVCLFALYHLKLARISPAIGFVLQCLSMVNQQQQYEWVATVKKSLEESVQELQQKEKPYSFKLQDLVFLDSESIFVMPSAFNDDVQFGLQVSRPTSLYALKALQLREKVFHWIGRAKSCQKQRLREAAQVAVASGAPAPAQAAVTPTPAQDATPTSSFASLSQWYEHARTVWQTLSMCGTDLLQFRTMRQVLMAQQLQEFCDALVQKHIDGRLSSESEALIQLHTKELRSAGSAGDVHTVDNAFRGQLDSLRDGVLQEMHHEFDEFVKAHDTKFTDEQVKSDKRFSLMGPLRRKIASVDSLWRSGVHLALEQRSMDHLFDEISARVNDLLLEQGASVNVENVERVFEEKWSQVMNETLRKQKPNLNKVVQEVVWHFNAALSNMKSQFRKAHIFHGVKSMSVQDINEADVCDSFLLSKKGVGDALVPSSVHVASNSKSQVDGLWIKLVDSMRLEVDQQGQMSDAAALKILNRLNSEMDAVDQLRQLLHRLGSAFVHRIVREIAKATMHYRFQIEQQNFQSRVREVMDKKQQKLWEIQARVDSGKREVHCAKVWAKTFVDTLDQHFRNAVGRMAQEIVSHMSNILTNPGNACELAIERSFTKRNWRHVVMYAIDPTQYLFMEFHKEWEQFKQGLVDQYCQELKSNFGSCLRLAEERMHGMLVRARDQSAGATSPDMTMNQLSEDLREACKELVDESLSGVLCSCLPSFPSDADWPLNNLEQFVQFASVELRRYRANMRQTEQTVERRMELELTRQKANCWRCICGCPARCPGCGTKCNLESENHWPERPHECRRHLYPAFNGWQKQEGRKPFLLHCRAKAQWQIARTRPPIEPGGPERYWDNFQSMLEDEHPDWLDPRTRRPLGSMEPSEDYEEDCTDPPEHISREIEENRRAWANCKAALLEHFTSMADDRDIEWLEKYKREGGALSGVDFASIRDELFAVTPLESMEAMAPMDDSFDDSF